MSSEERRLLNPDEVDTRKSPEPSVGPSCSSASPSLNPSSLPTISLPPTLPPRSRPSESTPLIGPKPSVPQPLHPYATLPLFSPLGPVSLSITPALQTSPLVTPNTSPTRQGSVIFCPASCESQQHQTPVTSLQPDHLRPSRRLGSKLIQKYISKIPVVSTSVSSLEPDIQQQAEVENTFNEVFDEESDNTNKSENMEAASRDLRRKLQLVKNHISDLEEGDIDDIQVPTVEGDLKEIQRERDDYRSGVEDFLEDFSNELDTAAKASWQASVTSLNKEVKDHAKKIRAKVNEVCPPMRPLSEFEKTQLEIQMRQLQLLESNANKERDNKILRETSEKSKTLALAKKKYDAFFEVSVALVELTSKYPVQNFSDPKQFPDQDISAMVRNITSWRNSLRDLTRDYNAFQELTVVHRLEEIDMENICLEMENARNSVNDVIKAIEKEDKDRNIRTLDSSKPEQRIFKKFGGTPGEDFLHFKKDFEEAVLANRISKSNQLEKLRECLSGEALKQVPKNMTGGLESAWLALKVMFGDPERLLKFRIKALDDLGKFPPSMKNGQPNYAAQATWLAK